MYWLRSSMPIFAATFGASDLTSGGHPFVLRPSVRYGAGTLPRSEALNRELIWFTCINAPNTADDMDDIVRGFENYEFLAIGEADDRIRRGLDVLDQIRVEHQRSFVDARELYHRRGAGW